MSLAPLPEELPVAGPATREAVSGVAQVALAGNPNTGKTTLFNHLCGLRAKTSNFPGTTTSSRIGRCRLNGDSAAGRPVDPDEVVEIVDLPGTYRVHLELPEARINRDVLEGAGLYRQPDAVVVVVDSTNLERNLCLLGEILASGLPVVVALNMIDLARRRGLSIDHARLAARLGCPVVPVMARRGEGVDGLRRAIREGLNGGAPVGDQRLPPPPPEDSGALTAWAERIVEESVGGTDAVGSAADSITERLDLAFTHPLVGVLIFAAAMSGLFWTVFALATIPMDLIELTFERLGGWVGATVPAGAIRDLLADGVIGGIAGTVVFVPQIFLLFFLISLIEDTGYLARAAFVMDRILCRFGLPGHAFVPLLSSHACAIPGILSTRLIPDRQDRLATILVAPFMSCSARLPVYVLLTTLLFREQPLYAGLAFVGCYALGAGMAVASAFVARRTILPGRSRPMVLELPSYKMPSLRTALYEATNQSRVFLEKAGTVIVAICIVMWWLSAYPQVDPPPAALELRQQAAALDDAAAAAQLEAEATQLEDRHAQSRSFAGHLGRAVQPIFAPLGYDWQLTVGVMTSFLAREVFVSTMAVLLKSDEDGLAGGDSGVIERIRSAERDDGSPVFTLATAASLLVFFVLAMQCLPTLAVTRRETGSFGWAGLQLVYMSTVAWILAFLTYQGLRLWGIA